MQPTDLALVALPSDPRLSPDGTTVAFVVTTADLETNQYRAAVWTVPTDGSAPARRITAGTARDGRPRWSPDGRSLAFTSHREENGSQLLVLPIGGGGEAGPIASLPEEIEDLEWSPDGRSIAFVARRRDEAMFAPAKDADRPARRVEKLGWKYNAIGWLLDRPRCLWVVPADGTARARVVIEGDRDVQPLLSWSPDSTRVAFAQARHDDADLDGVVDLWTVTITSGTITSGNGGSGAITSGNDGSGDVQRLTTGTGNETAASWSPDGDRIAYYHYPPFDVAETPEIRVLSLSTGTDTLVAEAAALDRGPSPVSASRLVWRGDDVYFAVEDAGRAHLYRTPAEPVVTGDRVVTGFDVGATAIVATISEPTRPGAVIAVTGDGERVLADFSARFAVEHPERFTAFSPDGSEIEAWLLRPQPFDPAATYPVLLNIHGGPYSQYGYGFFDEFQVQSAAGYAVLYCNPRGSSGYGAAWGRSIRGPRCDVDPGTGWGSVDADDVLATLDAALTRYDFLDAERVGVLGGSYGGYLTSWLVGHSHRFAAACSERAVNNVLSMTHTSDIGWWFNTAYAGVTAEDDPMELLRVSPVTYADHITTPLLIIHSEDDFRCPIEQAEDLFLRLRRRGRHVEMVRFPGENHELSRSGAPKHRLERFEIILEFFARWLSTPTVE